MPLVNVELVEGVFSAEQKQQIMRDLTETMVAIEGENMRPVTWVIVEEVRSGDWGIAGNRVHRRRQGPGRRHPGRLTRAARRARRRARAPARCRALGLAWGDGRTTFARGPRAVLDPDPKLVRGCLRHAHPGPGRRLGRPRLRPGRAGGRPHRVGQDPGRVPVGHRPPGHRPGGPRAPAPPGPLHLPAQGPGRRHRAQPPVAPGRPAGGRGQPGRAPPGHHRRHAHRRHPGRRPPPLPGATRPTSSSPPPSRCSCCSPPGPARRWRTSTR